MIEDRKVKRHNIDQINPSTVFKLSWTKLDEDE